MSEGIDGRRWTLWDHVNGARVQGSVIGALIMREMHTRYGRTGLGFVWLILEPMILAGLVVTIRGGRGHAGAGMDPVAFVILGYTMFILFRNIWNRSDSALEANMTLLHHRMVTVFDIVITRALLEAVSCFGAFVVLMGVCLLANVVHPPARPYEYLIGFLLLWWWAFAWSLLIVAGTHENPAMQKFVHPISYILLPLSGAFVIVDWLPYSWHKWTAWWPFMTLFEQLRYGWFETASPDHRYLAYTAFCCLFLTFLGLVAIRVVRRKVHLQ
ncbi:ABC transporter permease [Sphingobium sp. AN641]|uniref:ABC transporter permease n=1 Tax=Sphingobium sp. AN641 TaxID=3133443 RepID=UPI0030C4626F